LPKPPPCRSGFPSIVMLLKIEIAESLNLMFTHGMVIFPRSIKNNPSRVMPV
jgi:hypothetical protein